MHRNGPFHQHIVHMFAPIPPFTNPYQSRSHLALIAVRVWKINSFSSQFVGHSLMPVMFVVIESGAIYSCTLAALLVSCLTKSWAQYLILDSVRPRLLQKQCVDLARFPYRPS